ncbi:MAG: putative metal-binding motif-containing protein, partial [Myxococcota bacterium]
MIWTAVFTAALWGCTGSDGKDGTIGDTGAIDGDGDGFTAADGDCDDEDALVAPGGTEVCDGIDNNCDGLVDEGVTSTFYADFDGDGFGDPSAPTDACSREDGFSAIGTDCDDDRDDVFPGAEEICDAADNNCDGLVDEGVTTAYYADADADTFGDPSTRRDACAQPDGFVLDDTDCDDARDDVSPAADEVCDEADNDCDTLIDEGVTTTYYVDIDDDAFGQSDVTTEACARPTGYADVPGDCDDANSAVNPDAVEACDTIDNDCDTLIDDEDDSRDPSLGGETFYADTDADTFGDPDAPRDACLAPDGYVADNTDCDDDAGAVNPDAGEICNDIDDDCDGLTDDEDRSVNTATGTTFYADTDTDTFGDPDAARDACDRPFGYVTDNTDCDDDTTTVNPAAAEICNDIDDDCDGLTDDEDGSTDLSTGETFYADTDADTFGDPDAPRDACLAPDGYVADNTDCDDDAGAVNPDAGEIC